MVTASAVSWLMVEAGPRQKAFLSGNEAPSLAQTPPKPHFAVLHGFRCFIGLLPSCCLISLWPFHACWGSAGGVGAVRGRRLHFLASSGTSCPQNLMKCAFLVSLLGTWMETGTKRSLMLWPRAPIFKDISLSLIFLLSSPNLQHQATS